MWCEQTFALCSSVGVCETHTQSNCTQRHTHVRTHKARIYTCLYGLLALKR